MGVAIIPDFHVVSGFCIFMCMYAVLGIGESKMSLILGHHNICLTLHPRQCLYLPPVITGGHVSVENAKQEMEE